MVRVLERAVSILLNLLKVLQPIEEFLLNLFHATNVSVQVFDLLFLILNSDRVIVLRTSHFQIFVFMQRFCNSSLLSDQNVLFSSILVYYSHLEFQFVVFILYPFFSKIMIVHVSLHLDLLISYQLDLLSPFTNFRLTLSLFLTSANFLFLSLLTSVNSFFSSLY
jgi:hypothetical protein